MQSETQAQYLRTVLTECNLRKEVQQTLSNWPALLFSPLLSIHLTHCGHQWCQQPAVGLLGAAGNLGSFCSFHFCVLSFVFKFPSSRAWTTWSHHLSPRSLPILLNDYADQGTHLRGLTGRWGGLGGKKGGTGWEWLVSIVEYAFQMEKQPTSCRYAVLPIVPSSPIESVLL